jgi:hypothetical protein
MIHYDIYIDMKILYILKFKFENGHYIRKNMCISIKMARLLLTR